MEIELAPSLVVKIFVTHPTVVEIALVVPVEIVVGIGSTVVVPTAVASVGSVEVSVAE